MKSFAKTPLYDRHVSSGARLVDFAGWMLPLEYKSVLAEAKHTRATAGLFDVSHMGEIVVAGAGALAFLQKMTPHDIGRIGRGQLQYNVFLDEGGGIIDDCMVYHQGQQFLCVVNAVNTATVLAWLLDHKPDDVTVIDRSNETAQLALQGPCALAIMSAALGEAAVRIPYMHFKALECGAKALLISRSGYTGEDGFEVYGKAEAILSLWDLLVEKGASYELALCGLGARDLLRIEAGYPLYGHELDRDTNPLEAALSWVVGFEKEFVGKEALLAAQKKGLRKHRIGFSMQERGLPRQGYAVRREGKEVGVVTSGTFSPFLNQFIGMAYVRQTYPVGSAIEINIRNKAYQATVENFSFVKTKKKQSNA